MDPGACTYCHSTWYPLRDECPFKHLVETVSGEAGKQAALEALACMKHAASMLEDSVRETNLVESKLDRVQGEKRLQAREIGELEEQVQGMEERLENCTGGSGREGSEAEGCDYDCSDEECPGPLVYFI